MSTVALNVCMQGKKVVIIGGGTVALRKLHILLKGAASVTVVAINMCPKIVELEDSGLLTVRVGSYATADLDNAFLVIAATSDADVNRQVCADARKRGILVVAADDPANGDCTFPAILQRGDLEIAVSTGGRCPTFAVDVRNRIAEQIGHEYGIILEELAKEREKLLTNGGSTTYNVQVLRSFASRLIDEFTERKEFP